MNVEILELLSFLVSGVACIASTVAIIVSAVKRKDVSKVADYQKKFQTLIETMLSDGKLTQEELTQLVAFFAKSVTEVAYGLQDGSEG